MVNLDDQNTYAQLDPQGMSDRIAEMGQQMEEAGRLVSAFAHPGQEYARARNIVILGMGGSAIGGDLVRSLMDYEATIPVTVSRDYRPPGFTGPDTLVIASSYSGGTEETLSATRVALDRRARVIAVTTGGPLADIAGAQGMPVLRFEYSSQPRAALGFSFGLLLGLMVKLGYLSQSEVDLSGAIAMAKSLSSSLGPAMPLDSNPAKQMATRLQGRLPVVYGAGILSEVARRWKGQFNENSKAWSYFEQLPELNHNAVVGYENPSELAARIHIVTLSSSTYHVRVAERVRITSEILDKRGISHETVEAEGVTPLAQMVHAIVTGDYASYYLAALYGTDPTPVSTIDFLKEQLGRV
jgi:glucose/mannose-6-phosphate isomerase